MGLLRQNANANGCSGSVEICELNWAMPSTYLRGRSFDMIVAADVLYNRKDRMFVRALLAHMPTGCSTVAYVAVPPRTDSPLGGFFEMLFDRGLFIERLENSEGAA